MPLLTYPLALLGAASIPALVTIYLMHSRFRPQSVSALFLWQAVLRSREGGVRVRRLQFPLIFFLELLIFVCLIAAAVDPRWRRQVSNLSLVVVLDDSVSMRAVADGDDARGRGMVALRDEIADLKPTSVRLLCAGARPRVLGPARPPDAIDGLLRNWQCVSPAADMPTAIHLAMEISDADTRVLALSDRPPQHPPADGRLRWLSCGARAINAGFTNAARSPGAGNSDRCLFQVFNPSALPVNTMLSVAEPGTSTPISEKRLTLAPGETQRIVVEVPASASTLTGTLSDDALAVDNTVWLPPVRPSKVTVEYAFSDRALGTLVRESVDASGLASVRRGVTDLLFCDAEGHAPPHPGCWAVSIISPPEPKAFIGPFVIDRDHPLCEGLDLRSVVWGAGEAELNRGFPVITAGSVPLVVDRSASNGSRRVDISFSPALSAVQHTPNWPILFWNLLSWRSSELPGFVVRQGRLGEELQCRLPTLRSAPDSPEPLAPSVIGPDGSVGAMVGDGLVSFRPEYPGLYDVTYSGRHWQGAVNLLSAGETDLSDCRPGTWGRWHTSETLREEYAGTSWFFGILALSGVAMHCWLMYRNPP